MFRTLSAVGALSFALVAGAANATVVEHSTTGFSILATVTTTATPADAYDAFIKMGSWWDSEHSFSGDSANFTVEAKPGGCWCETLPDGGFVRHAEVIHANPGKMLVLSGGVGPMQSMGIAGTMTVRFDSSQSGTIVTLTYAAGGHDPENFEALAKAVDDVFTGQLERFKSFVDKGAP
jgi:hypothetical protein